MDNFFKPSVKQNDNFLKKLEDLKQQWGDHKDKLNSMKMNKDELVEYTRKLSDGYVSNINIIVDISTILINYREFMGNILDDMDNMFKETKGVSMISQADIDKIKNSTDSKIGEITNYFKTSFPALLSEFKSKGFNDTAVKLNELQRNFESIIDSQGKLKVGGGRRNLTSGNTSKKTKNIVKPKTTTKPKTTVKPSNIKHKPKK